MILFCDRCDTQSDWEAIRAMTTRDGAQYYLCHDCELSIVREWLEDNGADVMTARNERVPRQQQTRQAFGENGEAAR